MRTRNVVLTDRQDGLIDDLVREGRFQNASEVLRRGVTLVEQEEQLRVAKLEALRAAVEVGWADAEAGRLESFDDVKALRDRIADIGRRARARVR